MSNERSNNPDSAEFAQICMKWLKSNKPTLTVKDRYNDSKLIYVRVPSEGLDYVYNISTYWLRANPNETRHFGFNAVYSPTAKICVFNDFYENRAFTIPKEEIAEECLFQRQRTAKKDQNHCDGSEQKQKLAIRKG